MKKYQELVKENIDEIEQLKAFREKRKELAVEERTFRDRASDMVRQNMTRRSIDLLDEAYEVARKRKVLDETIAEYEDYFDTMLYQEYETAPAHTQRQGFAGFYRESGL